MPQMGYDMQSGTVVRWLKPEGSEVQTGDPIAEIETDKAVVEFESYASGVLRRILVLEGATVPVGEPIAIVADAGEELDEAEISKSAPVQEAPAAPAAPVSVSTPAAPPPQPPPPAAGAVRASPVARRLADERGIDISQVTGTGPGGRVTKDDVLGMPATAAPVTAAAPAAEPVSTETVPLSRMRQQIARVTVKSKQEKPHFYVSSEIDMTRAMELRGELNQALEAEGVRVTVNDLIIRACVEALKEYPEFNAYFEDEGVRMNDKINVGVAIALEEGLVVPAIMDCAHRSIRDIARASRDLAQRTEGGTLHPEEYTGGTFAISNLGMFDVTSFVAIIHPPQTAVLAVGTVAKRPVVRDDQVAVAQTMTATLSADHRMVDGAEGARFIVEVKRLLENPVSLLL